METDVSERSLSEHRLGKPVKAGDVTIIPVNAIYFSADDVGGGYLVNGTIEPLAVIIVSPGGAKAVDMDGRELSHQEIVEMAPELGNAFGGIYHD